ncbi:MAG: hypothetical protein QOJ50_734 [Cryptosporangiaceae bacterium]|nr:hypothetical protein [Cryptosporangiaceae bacterium]
MSTNEPVTHSIVVGIDGSEASDRAVDWAAHRASLHRLPLTILHAFLWPGGSAYLGAFPAASPDGWQAAAEELVRGAVRRATAAAPDVEVHSRLAVSPAAAELVELSGTAAMIVVGNRGRGGFAGLLLGSAGVQVAAHARCPVIVVRGAANAAMPVPYRGQVVAGVDGSGNATAVLDFAFGEASARGAGLTVVHAWTALQPGALGDMVPLLYEIDAMNAEETRALAEILAGWQEKYPDVQVNRQVVHAAPAKELVAASNGAELLVVGTRGHGGFEGLLMGSVSQAAIHHASCPVAVIHS